MNKKFYFNNGNYYCPSRWNCMNHWGYGPHYMNHWNRPHWEHWDRPHWNNHWNRPHWEHWDDSDDYDWSDRMFKSRL